MNIEKTIKHTFSYAYPPEVIWEYLTDTQLLAEWLMANDFKPIVGHKSRFKTEPKFKFKFDGTVYCEVLEVVLNKKLVYSWKGGMGKDKTMLDTIVSWTLESTKTGTDLTLEHSGFKMYKNYIPHLIMNLGWKKIGKRLSQKVAMGKYGTSTV